MNFSSEELQEFRVEALELLDAAEQALLGLDQGQAFRNSFDEIFRGFHSLKGAAGMMELTDLQKHTHELESILIDFKEAESLPKHYITFFLAGIDGARTLLNGQPISFNYSPEIHAINADVAQEIPAMESLPPETHVSIVAEDSPLADQATEAPSEAFVLPAAAMEEFIAEGQEILERLSADLQMVENKTFTKETIDALYRDVHSLKGSAYLFSYKNLGDLGHAMESSLEGVRSGSQEISESLVDCLFQTLEIIEQILERIKSESSDQDFNAQVATLVERLGLAAKGQAPAQQPEPQPEEPTLADQQNSPANKLEQAEAAAAIAAAPPVSPQTNHPEAPSEGASSVRVPVALLDNLMTLMGEMVLVRNQVLQYSNKSDDLGFISMSKRLNVVTAEIQGEMMKTRMQPIGNVLGKFTRVVRDLSHDLKKQINFVTVGAETELDKSLLEAIKDPLTHIVRNSCDHGIETPEIRKQNGKQAAGTIKIKAYHEGGQVVIEVSDDGKGLHKEVLIKKAIEKGVLTQAQVLKMTDKEIFALIFAPGFSTAEKVTNVSGRGVGMDVVRTNIEKIGGTVDLSSNPGMGTVIKIKIPLTLAIVPALTVKSGNATFAIPQVKLEELVRIDQSATEHRIEVLHGAPVYRLRGNILPLVDLNRVLGLDSPGYPHYPNQNVNIAVLNAEQSSFGLIIDEVQDTADIVVKPLNRLLKSLQVYSGATILGDGSVVLILDVVGLSKVAQISHQKSQNQIDTDGADRSKGTLDMQDFLLVRLGSSSKHAVALSYVNRLEEFESSRIELSGEHRVIRYRDSILPLISANKHLGYPEAKTAEKIAVVVVQKSGTLYGIQVDEILDTLSTTAELDRTLNQTNGIFGNLNTKEELIVVIDPFSVINGTSGSAIAAAQVSASPIASKNSGRILLVEDTVFFRKTIQSLLEERGFTVQTAGDGKEALGILANEAFDLIVSDIEMPHMNGFQLAKAVRGIAAHATLPMLAVSARAEPALIRQGLDAGFNVYLEKLNPTELLASCVKLIAENKPVGGTDKRKGVA